MPRDLTVLYVSASRVPAAWQAYQIACLRAAIGDAPVISVTRAPLALGINLRDETPTPCYWNIYHAMLRASRIAETPYVAMAEDDVLYTREHFTEFRPPLDAVSFDRSRWSLFTWDPIYCLRQRVSNCSFIAPRALLIGALEEREAKWPQGAPNSITGEVGRPIVARNLGVPCVPAVEWYSTSPIVHLNHPEGTDNPLEYQRDARGHRMIKKHGQITAIEIPVWGKAVDLAAKFC